jgi:flavin reductase (DIM6/NTAB) family NADH-FMN oxidoreductase RutF
MTHREITSGMYLTFTLALSAYRKHVIRLFWMADMMISRPGTERGGHKSLRAALGQFATGVGVVTAMTPEGSPAGMTINSHSCVSLDPPLILWCLRLAAARFSVFAGADHFAVNALAADQEMLARRFAGPPAGQFARLPWRAGPSGVPLLPGILGSFVCRRADQVRGGDHLIIIGQLEHYEVASGQTPLIFFGGRYHGGLPQPGHGGWSAAPRFPASRIAG